MQSTPFVIEYHLVIGFVQPLCRRQFFLQVEAQYGAIADGVLDLSGQGGSRGLYLGVIDGESLFVFSLACDACM